MNDKEVIIQPTDDYEKALNNAGQWRDDIDRLLQTQQNERFVDIIKDKVANATKRFELSLKQ